MRSLFCKLFLSFFLITLIASVTTAMISYWAQIGPYGELIKRVQHHQVQTIAHSLAITGRAAVKILEKGHKEEAVAFLREVEEIASEQLFLLNNKNLPFSDRPLPPGAGDLAVVAGMTDDMQYNISDMKIMVALPLVDPSGQKIVIVGSTDRIFWPLAHGYDTAQKQGVRKLPFHLPLGLPLLVMACIAASGCYLLARSLTAPIRNLRKTVQQITKGDFSSRVDLLSRRGDEIADLSCDFNTMVGRTESMLKSQKRLLRDISHELRSPLTRLNIASELARQRPDNAEIYLARIEKESDRMNELIAQLLMLTRLEDNVDNTPKEQVNLQKLIRNIVEDADFEATDGERRIKIQNLDDVTVLGNKEMLGRALENVIRNGLHYTTAKSAVEIDVSKGDDFVTVTVVDHGPGVPQEYFEQIFKPFFRVAESRDRDSGGTGIGLAIARQAIITHGGSIKAKNGIGGGLVVEIRLPLF